MSHAENVAKLQAVLAPNSRAPNSLFLNHDEQILKVISCDGSNPSVHFTPFWIIKFFFKLIRTCCCWLFFWNRGTEKIKNVLVLTNQRLIKFKESTGSANGDFPKRWRSLTPFQFASYFLRLSMTLYHPFVMSPDLYFEQVLRPTDAPFYHFLHRIQLQSESA